MLQQGTDSKDAAEPGGSGANPAQIGGHGCLGPTGLDLLFETGSGLKSHGIPLAAGGDAHRCW